MKRGYQREKYARGFDVLATTQPKNANTQTVRQAVQEHLDQILAAEKRGLSKNEIADILIAQWKAEGIRVANSTLRGYIYEVQKERKTAPKKRSKPAPTAVKKRQPARSNVGDERRPVVSSNTDIIDALNEEV